MKSLQEYISESASSVYAKDVKTGTVVYYRYSLEDETIHTLTVSDITSGPYWDRLYVEENEGKIKSIFLNDNAKINDKVYVSFTDDRDDDREFGYASLDKDILVDNKNLKIKK